MSTNAFELLSLTMRYVFTGLMLLIVIRAARGAIIDSRRATRLRRLSPMTGISGELVLLDALPRIPRGMRWPVIREGSIGTSRRCDIRIRSGSLRGRHALFQLTESGLSIRTHAGARMRDSLGHPAKELTLVDGDSFYLGGARLLLVLSVPDLPRKPTRPADENDDDDDEFDDDAWFDVHENDSDPDVSPIFERKTSPRAERTLPRRDPRMRRSVGSDSVSPIFDADRIVNEPSARKERINPRVFLDDPDEPNPDDLFEPDEDF